MWRAAEAGKKRAMSSHAAPQVARNATRTPIFQGLARAGYVARGLLYVVIGVLAIRLAQGVGGAPASQQGALRTIAHQPFGHALLIATAIGLAGYAILRFAQVFVGSTPEHGRYSPLDRIAAAGSGLAYGTFCILAIAVLRGSSGSTKGHTPQQTTAGVLDWPAGRVLVGAAGVVFLGMAAYQVFMALSRKFLDDSKTHEMSPGVERGFTALGVVGLLARGVVFGLIGLFVLKAAIEFRSREAVGLDGALTRLTHHAYGTTALYVVAAGLVVFGLYSMVDARYRKI